MTRHSNIPFICLCTFMVAEIAAWCAADVGDVAISPELDSQGV